MDYALRNSWSAQRFSNEELAAMHIDLQTGYCAKSTSRNTAQATKTAGQFSSELRELQIPNYFVAAAFHDQMFSYADFKKYLDSRESKNSMNVFGNFETELGLQDQDVVITKTSASVTGNQQALRTLKDNGIRGIFLTGIFYDACFYYSALGLIREGFYVSACLDATDCLEKNRDEFSRGFSTAGEIIAPGKLHVTTTAHVLSERRMHCERS